MTGPATSLLDLRWLATPGGVGRVAEHIARGLSEVDAPDFELTLWGSPERIGEIPGWCSVEPSQLVGSEARGQRQAAQIPPHDGGLFLHQVRPMRAWDTATLVHDTIQLRYGNVLLRRAKRNHLLRVGRRSPVIATVSEFSRRCIIDDLKVPEHKVHRLHLPVDRALAERVRARRRELAVQPAGDVGDILYVGRTDPHKNLVGLVEAFARSGVNRRARLRIFGAGGRVRRELLDLASKLGIAHIDVPTALSDDDLVDAYARAAVVVQPSLEEGWSLPTYEAIACGIPVIASDRGALPEQSLSAVAPFRLVDIADRDALTDALSSQPLDADPDDMDRASVVACSNGPTRAALAADVLDIISLTRGR